MLLFGDKKLDKDLTNLKERAWVRFNPKDERKRANDIFVAQFSHKDKDFDMKREKNRSNRAFRRMVADDLNQKSEDSDYDLIDETNPEECDSSSEEPVELDEDV